MILLILGRPFRIYRRRTFCSRTFRIYRGPSNNQGSSDGPNPGFWSKIFEKVISTLYILIVESLDILCNNLSLFFNNL
jgi:hypothetical protein